MDFNSSISNRLNLKHNDMHILQINDKIRNHSLDTIKKEISIKEPCRLTHSTICNLEKNLTRDIPMDNNIAEISLTDNARLCFKTLVSPLAIFFHVGKFALASISTTLSFAVAFGVSDFIFFSFLNKFSLTYPRYVLLAVTGVVALFSIKGIASSCVNFFLSFFKGTYSWYFSLVNPNCSFIDFLFGRNRMTTRNLI